MNYPRRMCVVLDAQISTDSTGEEVCRILVQGVFSEGAPLPPPLPGADRNVIRVFEGSDMRSVSAFRIPLGSTAEDGAATP